MTLIFRLCESSVTSDSINSTGLFRANHVEDVLTLHSLQLKAILLRFFLPSPFPSSSLSSPPLASSFAFALPFLFFAADPSSPACDPLRFDEVLRAGELAAIGC